MTRFPDWQGRYATFLSNRRSSPYVWGVNDCCTYAADGIKVIAGTDIAEDFRGYTDEAGAYLAIRRVCGGKTAADAVAYCATKYKMVPLPTPLLAQRGDLLIVQDGELLSAGMVDMHGNASMCSGAGVHTLPITSATLAYRI